MDPSLHHLMFSKSMVQNRLGIVPSSGRGTFLLGAGQRIVFLVNMFMIYNQFSALLDEGGVYNLKFYKPWFTYYKNMFTTHAGCSIALDIQRKNGLHLLFLSKYLQLLPQDRAMYISFTHEKND
ncbi:hypothetical protein ACJX0J_041367 [Zea mays]